MRKIVKLSRYQTYYIDSNQNLHYNEDRQVVFADGPNLRPCKSNMADSRHHENIDKSRHLHNDCTDFDDLCVTNNVFSRPEMLLGVMLLTLSI